MAPRRIFTFKDTLCSSIEVEIPFNLIIAAIIRVVAALSVALEAKFYFLAIAAEVLIHLTLFFFHRFEKHNATLPLDTTPVDSFALFNR